MTLEAGFADAQQQPDSERATHSPHACARTTVGSGHALEVPAPAARMSPPTTRAHARTHERDHKRITLLDGRRALVSALPRRARCVSHGPAVGREVGGQVAGAVAGEERGDERGDEVLAGEPSAMGVSGGRPPASGHLCYPVPDTGEGRGGRGQGGQGRGTWERTWRAGEGRTLESAGGRLSPYSRVITPVETAPSCVSLCVHVCACVCARARACGIDECR